MAKHAAMLGSFGGGLLGGATGYSLSPAWEMSFLTMGPVCLVSAAFAGLLSAHSWKGTGAATLLALLTAVGMRWLASKNPDWVVHQAIIATLAGVGVGVLAGVIAPKWPSTRGVPGE